MPLNHLHNGLMTYSAENEQVHTERWRNESQLHIDRQEHAEVNRMDVQFHNNGVKYRNHHEENGARPQEATHNKNRDVDNQEE